MQHFNSTSLFILYWICGCRFWLNLGVTDLICEIIEKQKIQKFVKEHKLNDKKKWLFVQNNFVMDIIILANTLELFKKSNFSLNEFEFC